MTIKNFEGISTILLGLALAACGSDSGGDSPGVDAGQNPDAMVSTTDAAVAPDATIIIPDAMPMPGLTSLVITTQPLSTTAGQLISVTVEARDMNDQLFTTDVPITLAIDTNPGTGMLGGTLTQTTSGGIATFADLFVNEAGVGYNLLASGGQVMANTDLFDISAGPAAGLEFVNPVMTAEAMGPLPTSVQIQDEFGNRILGQTDPVTVRIATNPGETLTHSSGNDPTILNTTTTAGASLGWSEPFASSEIRGAALDPVDGLVYMRRIGRRASSYNPNTDEYIELTRHDTDSLGGMAYNSTHHRFLVLRSATLNLGAYDFAAATTTVITTLVAPNIQGFTGFAVEPVAGMYYAVGKDDSDEKIRRLVTINPVTFAVTEIGIMGDTVSSIAFLADGTLMATVGDGGTMSESLFTVGLADASLTLVTDLANGTGDGEFAVRVPARLRGTTTVNAVDGIAVFPNLRIDAEALGYTLEASSNALLVGTTPAFNVTPVTGVVGVPTLDLGAQTVAEDVGTVDVAVTIDAAQTHDVILTYEVSGTATNPGDSNVVDTKFFNITIVAGQTTALRTIDIVDDAVAEGDETITFTLMNSAMASPAGAIAATTITITDND